MSPTSTSSADAARATTEAHEATGPEARRKRYAEIDALAATFRSTGDPEVALALADRRIEAAIGYDEDPVHVAWPPPYADPFPDHVPGTLPEVEADRMDAPTVAGAIAHHGSCVVRGLFSADQAARTVEAIDRVMTLRTPDQVEPLEPDAWYRPYTNISKMHQAFRAMVVGQGGTWLADSPMATAQVMEDLRDAGAIDLVTEHFGERPFFSLQKSTLRYSEPKNDHTGWHQDGSFLGASVRTLNVWIALTDCGGDHLTPGLAIVPRRVDELLERDGNFGTASISHERVLATAGDTPPITPEFKAGDALVFDQMMVHRTHLFPGMELPRYALECWMFAPAHAAEEYVPLVI